MTYHIRRNSTGNVADTTSGHNTPYDDLSDGVGRSLEERSNANEQTAEEDRAFSANFHAVKADAERHYSCCKIVDRGNDGDGLKP